MKYLKALKTKKGRDETRQFIIEGKKFVDEIPESWQVCQYVASQRFAATNDLAKYQARAACDIVRDSIFDSLADTVSPQGLLAVCQKREWQLSDLLNSNAPSFILVGENLNDPGNIGALMRTAAAAGANGIVLTSGSGDIYNPKVLRAAAGAVLRMPFITDISVQDTAGWLADNNIPIFAAHPRGSILPYRLDLKSGFCFFVGNESHGLSEEAANHATTLVSLPMVNDTESLNASVAGSILLYEAVRQRLN